MALIDGKKFSKITHRYRCDDEVKSQIREFIISTMMPDDDVVLNHCIVTVPDLSKMKLLHPRQSRFFDVVFHVMYFQIGQTFIGEPVLKLTYDAAWELSKVDYEFKMAEQLKERSLLSEAMEIINPSYIEWQKIRHFFSYRGVLHGVQGKEGEGSFKVTFQIAKELAPEEYGDKAIEQELTNYIFRAVKEIINPIYKTKTNG